MAMITLTFGNFSIETCGKLDVTHGTLIIVQEFLVGCTLVLRVLAMCSFNRRVVFMLSLLALIVLVLGAWSVVPSGPAPTTDTNLPGCHSLISRAQSIRLAAAWEAQLAGDIILLTLTLCHGYNHSERGEMLRAGLLWRVLVRDGAMYFGIICLANLANILMYYFGDMYTSSSISTFTVSLSVTMICRLMLNLHEAAAIGVEPWDGACSEI